MKRKNNLKYIENRYNKENHYDLKYKENQYDQASTKQYYSSEKGRDFQRAYKRKEVLIKKSAGLKQVVRDCIATLGWDGPLRVFLRQD